ncbi:phospholipase D-like domain-containing protein [Sorangium sp. So ce693]|uniref:phospholipase D-like domain-containing protein n=1 Tax=Sorangium sp. So ce693 TaxID=3133318 RepID=UPI003F601438
MNRPQTVNIRLSLTASALLLVGCVGEIAEDELIESVRGNIETSSCNTSVCAHFDAPAAAKTNSEREVIISHLLSLIGSAQDDSEIHGAIYNLDIKDIAVALVEAASDPDRRVKVNLVADGCLEPAHWDRKRCKTDVGSEKWEAMTYLYNNRLHPSVQGRINITFCHQSNGGTACFGDPDKGIQHAKYFLFSSIPNPQDPTAAVNATWIGSANLTDSTGKRKFNDGLTVYGSLNLYNGMIGYYNAQTSQGNRDAQPTKQTIEATDVGATVYLLPEFRGNPLAVSLSNHLSSFDVANNDCIIRVAHQSFGLVDIFEVLRDFAKKGCKVQVAIGRGSMSHVKHGRLLRRLAKKTNAEVKVWGKRDGSIHSKMVVLTYKGRDGNGRYVVYTGSQNISEPSVNKNDELLVEINGQALHDAYSRHFDDYWTLPTGWKRLPHPG